MMFLVFDVENYLPIPVWAVSFDRMGWFLPVEMLLYDPACRLHLCGVAAGLDWE